MEFIETSDALEAIYGQPGTTSLVKEVPEIIPEYAAYIEASPFCLLATIGADGMDCSPRGDRAGFVRILDERTLAMPDRRGNNRIDSIRNIVDTGHVALCFLIPGSKNCLRVNGEAKVTADDDLCQSFAVDRKTPRSVILIKTKALYFQCGRAIIRSMLWDINSRIDPKILPTPGSVLERLSKREIDGGKYDEEWQGRAMNSLW